MRFEDYTLVIRPDDNGTYVAHLPAIPGCHALGNNPSEAQSELHNVFDMIQEEYQEEGKSLPPDCEITVAHASLSH